jgi:hypothetical protein
MSEDAAPARRGTDGLGRVADFCRLAVRRTGVDGMAVGIVDNLGSLEPVFGTDAIAGKVSELQFTLGEGPGVDAVDSGLPVMVADLSDAAASRRWPLFGPEAALAVQALHAFPLGSGRPALGSVLLHRRAAGGLDELQIRQAISVAELLTLTLVDPRAEASVGSGLRMSVHQAAGMVMQQTGTEIGDALVLLRATAYVENRPITELAAEIVAGERRFPQINPGDGERR